MLTLTTAIRTRYHAWSCCRRPDGWRAIGTTPDGAHVVTPPTDSPEEALRALLGAP